MDSEALSFTIANFSAKFLNELDKDKSVACSPLSAEFLLALLALGASEPAHAELSAALGIPDDDAIRSSFSSVSRQLKLMKGVTLNVANKVYIKEGAYELQPRLAADAADVFDAGFEKVDFTDGAAAADLINKWVESKTNSKIKNIVSSDSVDSDTRLVLINALYFKGGWDRPFEARNTKERQFHIDKDTTVTVPMMFMRSKAFKYGRSKHLEAKLLELPYKGEEASMVFVLPQEIDGLNGLLKKLADGYNLIEDIKNLCSTKVTITIPKFKIETEINLMEVLPKIGIKAIFNHVDSGLGNTLLDNKELLYVSKAIQKAFIEVNEEGTEAAACTGKVLERLCRLPVFCANRPFLYLITSSERTVLFVGVYRGESSELCRKRADSGGADFPKPAKRRMHGANPAPAENK